MMLPALLATALVWIPPEAFVQWSRVDALLRARPELKLTVALTPAMATPLAKSALGPWVAAGRVEVAARIPGDPVLPWVAAHPLAPRPDDALERAAAARRDVERALAVGPVGFVPGAGALEPTLLSPLGASGAPWVLTGPYEVAGGSWAAEGRVVFVPARSGTFPSAAPPGAGALIVDDSARPSSLPDARADAGAWARRWATVSELAASTRGRPASASDVRFWPSWDGAPPAPPAGGSARDDWDAYGRAAKALAGYQNSGTADLAILDEATALLRRAQDARFFLDPGPAQAAELRSRLLAVYRRLNVPAPDSLYEAAASTAAAPAELPTGVRVSSGPAWLAFDNPIATVADAPPGAPNADPWRLRALRVEWDEARVLFRLLCAHVDAAPPAPRPAYDVYIDLNHRVGSGLTQLLDGRAAFAQARDAWEFALEVRADGADLWRAGGAGPEKIAALRTETSAPDAEIRVSVPRELLRGNPERWGYTALALSDGGRIDGLIAPLEVQKAVLEGGSTPRHVFAARLTDASRP